MKDRTNARRSSAFDQGDKIELPGVGKFASRTDALIPFAQDIRVLKSMFSIYRTMLSWKWVRLKLQRLSAQLNADRVTF